MQTVRRQSYFQKTQTQIKIILHRCGRVPAPRSDRIPSEPLAQARGGFRVQAATAQEPEAAPKACRCHQGRESVTQTPRQGIHLVLPETGSCRLKNLIRIR